jgi:hypothetical protein
MVCNYEDGSNMTREKGDERNNGWFLRNCCAVMMEEAEEDFWKVVVAHQKLWIGW